MAASRLLIINQMDVNNAFLHGELNEDIYMKLPQGYQSACSNKDNCFMALFVYVDDILLIGDSCSRIAHVKTYLDDNFTIKDLGDAKFFLWIELLHNSLKARKYTLDILKDTGLIGCKPPNTPIFLGTNLTDMASPLLIDINKYRWLVGRLLYLGFTRLDITYVVQ
ncbi:hypothetical protein LIER_16007 [Lithospermum erythrorhizon]|uniref:Reverse transcriptase Ty1/copia-type domain-containing protein n=1 Tax=Lithospermum erythrorhizon TaxID=34254 RepID=A0AAV3Q7J4_LITER